MTIFVKVLYILNFCGLMGGMTVITIRQKRGDFYCDSITVNFGDDIWENALVLNSTGGIEERDLVYSYFNGVYVFSGNTIEGRPIYVEQNKFNSEPYEVKIGATIRYCKNERAWVFMHENIRKDVATEEADCPWLLRSPETHSFNLLDVSGDWTVWTGIMNRAATFHTICNTCDSEVDCNYHGQCIDGVCDCQKGEDGFNLFTGTHCELSSPCPRIQGDNGDIWNIDIKDKTAAWRSYGRIIYAYESGGNNTWAKEDQLELFYTGSRWFFTVFEGGKNKGPEFWSQYALEMHAFWDQIYNEFTKAVSNPTSKSDPIAVDFFTIGRRGERYGPFGELIPLQDTPGSGYFECALNGTVQELLDQILSNLQG